MNPINALDVRSVGTRTAIDKLTPFPFRHAGDHLEIRPEIGGKVFYGERDRRSFRVFAREVSTSGSERVLRVTHPVLRTASPAPVRGRAEIGLGIKFREESVLKRTRRKRITDDENSSFRQNREGYERERKEREQKPVHPL